MGAKESGQAFLASVLAKLPESLRAQAKAAFEAPEAAEAVTLAGDGALARSDYSRHMDDLKAKETELATQKATLDTWWRENQGALEEYVTIKPEYDTLKAGAGRTGDPDPAKPVPQVVDPRKIAEDVVNEQGRDYIQLTAWLAGKAVEHFHTFGEPLNTSELVSDPKLGKPVAGQPGRVFSLPDAYAARFGERLAQKAKDAEDTRINVEVEKRYRERIGADASHPFPLRNESPSVLDALTPKDGTPAHTLDTALAEYDRLQAARST